MTKPMIKIHNLATDEVIEREMTDAEFASYQKDLSAEAERQAEAQAKAQAKTALLEQLGITEEQAKLLLS